MSNEDTKGSAIRGLKRITLCISSDIHEVTQLNLGVEKDKSGAVESCGEPGWWRMFSAVVRRRAPQAGEVSDRGPGLWMIIRNPPRHLCG